MLEAISSNVKFTSAMPTNQYSRPVGGGAI